MRKRKKLLCQGTVIISCVLWLAIVIIGILLLANVIVAQRVVQMSVGIVLIVMPIIICAGIGEWFLFNIGVGC